MLQGGLLKGVTGAYPLWYVTGNGSRDTVKYKPPQAVFIQVKRESGPAKACLRRGKDNVDPAGLGHSNAMVFRKRATNKP